MKYSFGTHLPFITPVKVENLMKILIVEKMASLKYIRETKAKLIFLKIAFFYA